MKNILFVLVVTLMLQSCLVKRTIVPKITGYVYDVENGTPVAGCNVNGVLTDSNGFYKVKWIGYREFTFIGIEGPGGPGSPNRWLSIQNITIIDTSGLYSDTTIELQEPFGTSRKKGDYWKMDTVFLKSTN